MSSQWTADDVLPLVRVDKEFDLVRDCFVYRAALDVRDKYYRTVQWWPREMTPLERLALAASAASAFAKRLNSEGVPRP